MYEAVGNATMHKELQPFKSLVCHRAWFQTMNS